MKWLMLCDFAMSANPKSSTYRKAERKTHAVFLLLYILRGAVLEMPTDDISVGAGPLNLFAALEGGPEVMEGVELDKVPHLADMGGYEGALSD